VDLIQATLLDLGNVRRAGSLQAAQTALGEVVAGVLAKKGVPVVVGGGHETAYGHFLGYVAENRPIGVINIDAHLDVRPVTPEGGHSGSPFRQMLEHPAGILAGERYVTMGVQPHALSREHWEYVKSRGGSIHLCGQLAGGLTQRFSQELARLGQLTGRVYISLDADVVRAADVPGVSAPDPTGLPGDAVVACARLAGQSTAVSSFELVEINPRHDRDGQSTRWAAVVLWNFLIGLAMRKNQ
jgi:formiminoglutamase